MFKVRLEDKELILEEMESILENKELIYETVEEAEKDLIMIYVETGEMGIIEEI